MSNLRSPSVYAFARLCTFFFTITLGVSAAAVAQTTVHVGNEAELATAIANARGGDTIVFDANITLSADLPSLRANLLTIEGNGHTLSGQDQYRGFFVGAFTSENPLPQPISVTVQNVTIADTRAAGGNGGNGAAGGAGGAGLGGGIFVADNATLTVANVSIVSSGAVGGNGGSGNLVAGSGSGGGGGMGGRGGSAIGGNANGGGGGGVGNNASGGAPGSSGGAGIASGADSGGSTESSPGGPKGGGGAGGFTGPSGPTGGGGGGVTGEFTCCGFGGGDGGYGGGGGGRNAGSVSGTGGFGGGGGGGTVGTGGFGGGGGGAASGGTAGVGGFGAGNGAAAGATGGGGGGGAGMGGAIFTSALGSLVISGNLNINGNAVGGGAGGNGAGNGSAFGSGIFLAGSGTLFLSPTAGATINIGDSIADQTGSGGSGATGGSWGISKTGAGTLILGGDNAYTGGTSISGAGRLSVSTGKNLGTGAVLLFDSTLGITGSGAFNNNLQLVGDARVDVSPGASAVWSGPVTNCPTCLFIFDCVCPPPPPPFLHLTGGGTLSLTNTSNTYSGGTLVTGNSTLGVAADGSLGLSGTSVSLGDGSSGGTLSISPGFSSGRTITLGAFGGTINTTGGNSTLSGTIDGSGGLTKSGIGTLILAGTSSFGGGINVTGGELRAGSANAFGTNKAININAGALLSFGPFGQSIGALTGGGTLSLGGASLGIGGDGSSSTFGGSITGSGSLTKNGGGTFTLTGSNSYSGGTTVNGGTLAGNTNSLQGNIVNNASVVFDQNFSGAYGGNMSGTGSLVKAGTGILALTGSNTYTGGTTISGGSIVGSAAALSGNVINNASLTFNQLIDGVFNGVLSGNGSFVKIGPGNLILNGAHPFTGLTSLNEGPMTINGSLGGAVNAGAGSLLTLNGSIGGLVSVAGGGTFNGNGSIGGLNLTGTANVPLPEALTGVASIVLSDAGGEGTFGHLRSSVNGVGGGSIRPLAARLQPLLTINGDLNATRDSVLGLTLEQGSVAPVFVTGRAVFTDAHLNVTADVGSRRVTSFTAVTAQNGMNVVNTDARSARPDLATIVTSDRSNLYVTLVNYNLPLRSVVTTNPNAQSVAEMVDRIRVGANGDLDRVLKELSAINDDVLPDALRSVAGEIHESQIQLAAIDSLSITDMVRDNIAERGNPLELHELRWWTQFAGEHTHFDGSEFISGGTANVGGGAGGFDYKATKRFFFGLGSAYSLGKMLLDANSQKSDLLSPRAFGYGGLGSPRWGVHFGGSAAKNKYKTNRNVTYAAVLPGINTSATGVDRHASSEQDGITADEWTEYKDSIRIKAWTLDTTTGVRNATYTRDPWDEVGALALSLTGGKTTFTSRQVDQKLHYWKRDGRIRPHFQFHYRYEHNEGVTEAEVALLNAANSGFTVDGLPLIGNSFLGRGGVTYHGAFGLEITLDYETRQSTDEHSHRVDFRMRFR